MAVCPTWPIPTWGTFLSFFREAFLQAHRYKSTKNNVYLYNMHGLSLLLFKNDFFDLLQQTSLVGFCANSSEFLIAIGLLTLMSSLQHTLRGAYSPSSNQNFSMSVGSSKTHSVLCLAWQVLPSVTSGPQHQYLFKALLEEVHRGQ